LVITQDSTSILQPLPSVTVQGALEGGEAFVVVVLVVVVVVLVVVVVVLVVVGKVVVVDVVVEVVDVVVCGGVFEGQSLHPSSCTEESEYHVITAFGVTPSGPCVPVYTTPSTSSLSYFFSVLKCSTTIGTALDSSTVIVQRSFASYLPLSPL